MGSILAVDQSYTATGLALVIDGQPVAWEVIKTQPTLIRAARREIIVKRIKEMQPAVDLVVIEELWEAPGISLSTGIIDAAYSQGKEIKVIHPVSWKKRMLGDGNASKAVSIQVAQKRTGKIISDDNIADAINIGVCAVEYPELLKQPEKSERKKHASIRQRRDHNQARTARAALQGLADIH